MGIGWLLAYPVYLQNPAAEGGGMKGRSMKLFNDMGIAKKIWLLVGLIMACMTASGIMLLIMKKDAVEAEKKLATKHVVEIATG